MKVTVKNNNKKLTWFDDITGFALENERPAIQVSDMELESAQSLVQGQFPAKSFIISSSPSIFLTV